MVCLDNDGSVIDACITTLITSLKTRKYVILCITALIFSLFLIKKIFSVTLPTVSYDVETEEVKVDPSNRIPLKVSGLPVATSFAIYQAPERYLCFSKASFCIRYYYMKGKSLYPTDMIREKTLISIHFIYLYLLINTIL